MQASLARPGTWLVGVLVGAGAVGAALTLAGIESPAGPPLTLLFLVLAPGAAVTGLLRGLDLAARLALTLAGSIAIDALVAEAMLVAGLWSPRGGLAAITVITGIGLALQTVRAWRGTAAKEEHADLGRSPG